MIRVYENTERFISAVDFERIMRRNFMVETVGETTLFTTDHTMLFRQIMHSGALREALLRRDLIFYDGKLFCRDAFAFDGDKIVFCDDAKAYPEKYCLSKQKVKYSGTELYRNPEPAFNIFEGYYCPLPTSSYYMSVDERFVYAEGPKEPSNTIAVEPVHEPPKPVEWTSSIFSVNSSVDMNRFDDKAFEKYMEKALNLPDDFGGVLNEFIIDAKKTREEVAFDSLISARNLNRLLKNEQRPKLETVVSLCIALHLFPFYSEYLIKSAGYSLRNTPQELAYRIIINQFYDTDIYYCNEFLRYIGVESLTEDPFGK